MLPQHARDGISDISRRDALKIRNDFFAARCTSAWTSPPPDFSLFLATIYNILLFMSIGTTIFRQKVF